MQVNPAIFKAYDIRGIYPTDLNEEVGYAIGRAFATFLKVDTVIVGRDMRLSGPQMFDAVTRGLMDQGADVINIGMVSTDQYYYACATLDHAGMMVTASHNPKEYSGFKMVRKMPQLLSGDQGIQDLRRIVENDDYGPVSRQGTMREVDLSEEFVEKLLSLIDVDGLADLKVIADTGNGMVGPSLQRVFDRLPSVELIGMYLDPDGSLPNHGLDPLQPENRAELQARVPAEGADVGFAFDGDGDRFFTIDDRGSFVAGDFMTALMGSYLLEKYPGSKGALRRARLLGGAGPDHRGGRDPVDGTGRSRLYQGAHGQRKCHFCRRGERSLLFQGFLLCRFRAGAGAADFGDALQEARRNFLRCWASWRRNISSPARSTAALPAIRKEKMQELARDLRQRWHGGMARRRLRYL
jgi:hypothetical protein